MEALVGSDDIADKVLREINLFREQQELGPLLNAFAEASNESVFHSTVNIAQISNELETELAVLEAVRELLNSESTSPRSLDPVTGPTQVNNRATLLDKFATHADVFINGKHAESDDLSLRLEVYFKYLELPTIGPVIDGDLVVQGTSLHPSYGPAICKVEFAADHEENLSEAALIAPWSMMYTPSSNPEENASEFAVPISLGPEHREGHVRVRIYVDKTENIAYGEEDASYLAAFRDDTFGERFVCALDFTTRATTAAGEDGAAIDGLAMGSVVDMGDGGMEGVTTGGEDIEREISGKGMHSSSRARPSRRSGAAPRGPPQPVVVDVKIAVGFDDLEALKAEGYHLSCAHLHDEGLKSEDEEGKWSHFLVAKYADVSAPPAVAAEVATIGSSAEEEQAVTERAKDDGAGEAESKGGEAGKEIKGAEVDGGQANEESVGAGDEKVPPEEKQAETLAADPAVVSEELVVEDLFYLQVSRDAVTAVPEGEDLAAALVLQGVLPDGYSLLPQDLLSLASIPGEGEGPTAPEMCVFVAIKRCPASQASDKIVSVGMFSCSQAAEHSTLPEFLAGQPGRALKAAPQQLAALIGEDLITGLLVGVDVSATAELEGDDEGWAGADDEGLEDFGQQLGDLAIEEEKHGDGVWDEERSRAHSSKGGVDETKGGDGGGEDWDVEDGDGTAQSMEEEEAEDEAVVLERMLERISNLSSEKDDLSAQSADLQRKVTALIAREKALQQGQSRAGTAPEEALKEDEAPKEEQAQEKQKQFSEILSHIVDARKKASQQQLEYDQLALDLQTRLDDREFKAGEIYESFKAFKKEILLKAENSRTSKPMSKRLIKQFEAAEAKREEDLERVRLRNISMRTQLKKMEKTLRAREQLAEGLYMIDFEQLKVENQTLYEKIEERSEELGKLKRKKTITVQMLTHVREKLHFIENANIQLNRDLGIVENDTMARRGDLTTTKKLRDVVRDDNKELKLKQGFSSSSGLKADFDARKGKLEDIKAEINELRERYTMLSRSLHK